MRVRAAVALLALAVVAVALALAGSAGAGGGSTTIKLRDNFFDPDRKSIAKGTKVRFKWTGSEEHNVTKKRGPGRNFDSETTDARGVNFSRKFKKAGSYRLICTVHPDAMKLRLNVG
jgi:plastocyanin